MSLLVVFLLTCLRRNHDSGEDLVHLLPGGVRLRSEGDEDVVDAEERHEDECGAHCLAQPDGRRVGRVAVQLGEQHAHHVDEEGEARQHRQTHGHRQDPLSVALVHPTPETTNPHVLTYDNNTGYEIGEALASYRTLTVYVFFNKNYVCLNIIMTACKLKMFT